MSHWVDELTPLRVLPKVLPAESYNRVRVALLRLGRPLRLQLEGLRGVDCVLDDHAWVCIDRHFDDLPLLAWLAFESRGRSALHAPMRCELRLFHVQSGLIMGPTLEALEQSLARQLHGARTTGS